MRLFGYKPVDVAPIGYVEAVEKAENRHRNPSNLESVKNFPHSYAGQVFSWSQSGDAQRTSVAEIIREMDHDTKNMKVHTGKRLGFGVGKKGYLRPFLLQERFKIGRKVHRWFDQLEIDKKIAALFQEFVTNCIPNFGKPIVSVLFEILKVVLIVPLIWYGVKYVITVKFPDTVCLSALGMGPERKRLDKLMDQEAEEQGPPVKRGIWSRFRNAVVDYKVGRSSCNRHLHIQSRPKDLFKGLTQVMEQEGERESAIDRVNEGKIVCPEEFIEGDDTATLITFATRMKHEHTVRRAQKETGAWGSLLYHFGRVEKYGEKKAKSCLERDQETIQAYDAFMDAAAKRTNLKGLPQELSPLLSENAMQAKRKAYRTLREKMERDLVIIEHMGTTPKLLRELEEKAERLNQLHQELTGSKEEIAEGMVQIYSWIKGVINGTAFVDTKSVEQLEAYRASVHDRLREIAMGDARWKNEMGKIANTSGSLPFIDKVCRKMGEEFLETPEVKELRALLEMTEGAIALAEGKISYPYKIEECINYGQMVYSELDQHFQVWIFNEHISPQFKHLDHFCQYVSGFGIYRFGPVFPHQDVLRRYPPLKVYIQKEYDNKIKGLTEALDNTGKRNETHVYFGDYLDRSRDCSKEFAEEYRFAACVEGDAGHKSFLLHPADKDPNKRALLIAEGTRFGKEVYEYGDRPNRSGVRDDNEISCAFRAANEMVSYKGKQVAAHVAVGNLMRHSPYRYVCMGHSLGAVTVQGIVTSKGFPVHKISRVAGFAGPGIRHSENIRFYEKAMDIMVKYALPETIRKGKENDPAHPALEEAERLLENKKYFEARFVLEEAGFEVADKIPTSINLTAKGDLVGHLGSAPYQLGLLNQNELERFKAVHKGTATVIAHDFVGQKGFEFRRWHNDQVFENGAKEAQNTEIILEVSDKNSISRKIIKYPWRAGRILLDPILHFLPRKISKYGFERYKAIYGYGTEEVKYGVRRPRNITVIVDE